MSFPASSLCCCSGCVMRFKLVAAAKPQFGWPGFTQGNVRRYLNFDYRITVDQSQLTYQDGIPLYPPGGPPVYPPAIQTWDITRSKDRQTGVLSGYTITPPNTPIRAPGYGSVPEFPYGQNLASLPAGWTVTENTFTVVILTQEPPLLGNVVTTFTSILSDEYTMAELEADVDALLAAADTSGQPWNSFQWASYGSVQGPYTPNDPRTMLPAFVNLVAGYGISYIGTTDLSVLSGAATIPAAWSVFAPGYVFAGNWFDNVGLKMACYVENVGTFCEKTYVVDWHGQPVSGPTCQGGNGNCSPLTLFEVTAPPLSNDSLNKYVTLTQNCVC